jgi:hypothetical protein
MKSKSILKAKISTLIRLNCVIIEEINTKNANFFEPICRSNCRKEYNSINPTAVCAKFSNMSWLVIILHSWPSPNLNNSRVINFDDPNSHPSIRIDAEIIWVIGVFSYPIDIFNILVYSERIECAEAIIWYHTSVQVIAISTHLKSTTDIVNKFL